MHTASTETLFRFVTMRKPEAASEKFKSEKLINVSNIYSGSFWPLIDDPEPTLEKQIQKLEEIVQGNGYVPQTLNYFEANYPQFYRFSLWLGEFAQDIEDGLTTISESELNDALNVSQNFDYNELFDVIIYHALLNTSNSNINEFANMVVAKYFLSKYDISEKNNIDDIRQYATAKLNFPRQLFAVKQQGDQGNTGITKSRTSLPSTEVHFANTQSFLQSKFAFNKQQQLAAFQDLLAQVQVIQVDKNKAYQAEYDAYNASRNNEIKEIIANTPYTINPNTGERVYDDMNLPEFNFTSTTNQLTSENLSASLSSQALVTYKALGISNSELSFEKLYSTINAEILAAKNNELYTPVQSSKTVVLGNAVIQTAARLANNVAANTYQVEAVPIHANSSNAIAQYKLLVHVNTGDATIDIEDANITFAYNNSGNLQVFTHVFSMSNANNIDTYKTVQLIKQPNSSDVLNKVFNASEGSDTIDYTGSITLSNGKTKKLAGSFNIDVSAYATMLASNPDFDRDRVFLWQVETSTSNGVLQDPDDNPIPADCVPTACSASVSKHASNVNLSVYSIHFTPPLNGNVYALKLAYTEVNSGVWQETQYGNTSPIIKELDAHKKYQFKLIAVAEGTCNTKETAVFSTVNNGSGSGSGGDGNNVSNSYSSRHIPPVFGIKDIGIAEFRRVEQTVCGYEATEVSNIENIMVGELREKVVDY